MAGICCNSIMLRLILLTNFDSVIDKCQTGMSITGHSSADVISDRTLIVCAGVFFMTCFFLIDECAYSRSFCVFFGVVNVNIFSSVNKMVLTSLVNILSSCFEWLSLYILSLYGGSFQTVLGRCVSSTNISQGSV